GLVQVGVRIRTVAVDFAADVVRTLAATAASLELRVGAVVDVDRVSATRGVDQRRAPSAEETANDRVGARAPTTALAERYVENQRGHVVHRRVVARQSALAGLVVPVDA